MLDNVVVIRPWQGLWQAFLPVLGSFRRASATLPIAIICVRARARAQYQYPSCSRGSCIYRLVLPQSTRPLRFIAPPESYRARRKLSRPNKVIAPPESYRVPWELSRPKKVNAPPESYRAPWELRRKLSRPMRVYRALWSCVYRPAERLSNFVETNSIPYQGQKK